MLAADAMFHMRQIESYMVGHADDVVQEGRWRAVLAKENKVRHRALLGRISLLERSLERLGDQRASRDPTRQGLRRRTW